MPHADQCGEYYLCCQKSRFLAAYMVTSGAPWSSPSGRFSITMIWPAKQAGVCYNKLSRGAWQRLFIKGIVNLRQTGIFILSK